MFPHSCGDEFERLAAAGIDPKLVVPDEYSIVKGGTFPIPAVGIVFSGAAGPTLEIAASAVPHGQLRFTTAKAIRDLGGIVLWIVEVSRNHTVNRHHVNIMEAGTNSFSELIVNPVSSKNRIDGNLPRPPGAVP